MDGILNIYKEKGFTSHDVVAVVRKTLNQKKVGHTGTLDPEAEGVLPVCLGRATKLADYIMNGRKTYIGELTLGVGTTTQDHTGEVLFRRPVAASLSDLEEAAAAFTGEMDQTPPMYSALKVDGKKLYELARQGKEVERKPRKIQIYGIRVLSYAAPKAVLEVQCSKGTYIRTLFADIGERLGCGGHMSALTRTATGRFTLENAIRLSELKALVQAGRAADAVLTMELALEGFGRVTVAPRAQKYLVNGGRIRREYFLNAEGDLSPGKIVAAYDHTGKLTGLFQITDDGMKPIKML